MPYIGNDTTSIVQSTNKEFVYTATAGQTAFTGADDNSNTLNILANQTCDVYLNGIRLIKSEDYTQSTNTITLTSGASLNDELVIDTDMQFAVADHYTKSETYTKAQVDAADSTINTSLATKAPISGPSFTDYVKIPTLTTTQRDALTPQAGYIIFNTTTATLNQYDGSNWTEMAKPPIVSSLSYSGSATAVDPAGGETVTITGANFLTGVNVKFGNTFATSVTRVNSTTLTVTVPALTVGDYDVYVVNGDGMQAVLSAGLTSNAAPVWTTASGSLGSIQNDVAITTITLVATEDDSGAITYTVTTGALPTGLSLSGADIDGTPTGYTAETTANFTITATDDEGQTTDRSFSLTVLVQFYSLEINNSLLFRSGDGDALDRTPTSAGNRQTWTWSSWVRRGQLGTNQCLTSDRESSDNGETIFYFNTNDELTLNWWNGGYTHGYELLSQPKYRDTNSWYHIMLVSDTTNSTDSDRHRIYVNGERIGVDFSQSAGSGYVPQNYEGDYNNTEEHHIGAWKRSGGSVERYFDGCMSDTYFVDGQALDPTSFGKFSQNIWIPIEYSGTYGTNGYHLDWSGTNFYTDRSGSGNNWGISGGLGHANVLVDTPTNTFATLNYQDLTSYSNQNITEGHTRQIATTSWMGARSTMGFKAGSGKWYAESRTISSGTNTGIGIIMEEPDNVVSGMIQYLNTPNYGYPGRDTQSWGMISNGSTGYFFFNNTTISNTLGQNSNGGYVMMAVDADNGNIWVGKDGVWSQGDPATGSNPLYTRSLGDKKFYWYSTAENAEVRPNFGGGAGEALPGYTDSNGYGQFHYQPPTGFKALCTANLPENGFGDIQVRKPSDFFAVTKYTGDGTTSHQINLDFQPDLVITKCTNNTYWWNVQDSVRGAGNSLFTNAAYQEEPDGDSRKIQFNSNGYEIVNGYNDINGASDKEYVSYSWKANGTAVTNTDGNITSQVSANTTCGFSILTYTGNGSSNQTIGHGLGVDPEFIIVKNRTTSNTDNWRVWHKSLSGADFYMGLNQTAAESQNSAVFNGHNSTTFTVGNDGSVNRSGDDYVAYVWHSVPGFSHFGKYWGNTSTNNAAEEFGFQPAFCMVKRRSNAQNWVINDNQLTPYNRANGNCNKLYPDTTDTTSTYNIMDILSNGFKIKMNSSQHGYQEWYIYAAFAEDPFKYSNAR